MKQRRFFMILMTICLCMGLFAVTASAAGGECGDVRWNVNGGTLTISGNGDMADYDYLNTVAPWHQYYESITKIVIKDGVEEIGDYAFADMVYATSVSIPDSVTEIGEAAFYNCQSLESIELPGSVTDIDDYAFEYCYSLKQMEISKNVTNLGDGVFSMCISLEEVDVSTGNSKYRDIDGVVYNKAKTKLLCVPGATEGTFTVPSGITAIEESAFSGCILLTEITIPNSVTRIGDTAFYYCQKLNKITIPNSVTKLGDGAFYGCVELSKATLSDKLASIPDMAFLGCKKLTSITIPSGVKTIGEMAFANCITLAKVTLPETLTTISDAVFYECHQLRSITLPDKAVNLGEYLFYGSGIQKVTFPAKITHIPTGMFYHCGSLKTMTLPDSVTTMGEYVFSECIYLKTVHLPNKLKSIPAYTFQNCYALNNVNIPTTITSIGKFAFSDCRAIERIALPDCIKEIPDGCFFCCHKLKDFKIPSNVTRIGDNAFTDCNSIDTFVIPAKVTYVGKYALSARPDSVTFLGKAPEFGNNVFYSTTTTCYYPNDGTWTNSVRRDYNGTITWKTVTAPTVTVSNVAKSGKIKLTWNKVENAVKYNVYRATAKNGKYTLLKSVTGNFFTNTGAETGKTYWYKVEAVAENGLTKTACAPIKATCKLKQPVVQSYELNKNGKPVLTWNAVEGATKYQIWRCTTQKGKYALMKTVTGTTYTNLNAKPGQVYYYKVVAVGSRAAANSLPSGIVKMSIPLAEPQVSIELDENGKPVLRWEPVEGAVKYRVFRCIYKNGRYTVMKTITGTEYTNLTAKRGQVYHFKVMAVAKNTACNSVKDTVVSIVCPPETPVVRVELNEELKPVLRWEAVDGAVKYQIWRCTTENGKYGLMKTVTGTEYVNLTAAEGQTYYFKVIAVGKNAQAKAEAEIVSVTCVAPVEPEVPEVPEEPEVPGENETPVEPIPLDAPVVTGALVEGVPVLSWDAVEGAVAYEIYKAIDDGEYVLVSTVTEPGYTEPEAIPGYTYSYKVVAVAADTAENSAQSEAVTVDCPLPENMTPIG